MYYYYHIDQQIYDHLMLHKKLINFNFNLNLNFQFFHYDMLKFKNGSINWFLSKILQICHHFHQQLNYQYY
ncbi:unnamed protein product [Paramecium pentaurelia]|uniref:Uncharacterized protein n=1 Tax=Paramecium pentaurelia TaxID=43138 RepID=A0A8S1SXD7_9CILI|nr:unnamed protein product [Paramecium pentaurelia]